MRKIISIAIIVIIFQACSVTNFDRYAYQKTEESKIEAFEVMDLASSNSFESRSADVDRFKLKLDSLFTYEKSRKNNALTVEAWKTVLSEGSTLNRFFKRWKEKVVLKPTYVAEKKINVGRLFDDILKIELNKNQ